MGFLAGWTNEGSGWVACAFTFFYLLYTRKLSPIYLFPLITSAIGYFSLVFSPGNFIRANHPSFRAFKNATWSEKFEFHFLYRIPEHFWDFWQAYLAIMVLLLALASIRKNVIFANVSFPVIFFLASFIVSISIFVASPLFAGRGLNPTFTFLLVTFSTLLFQVLRLDLSTYMRYVLKGALIFLVINFSYSYFFVKQSYDMLNKQSEFRAHLIDKAKQSEKVKTSIDIPHFYNRLEWINKWSDNFDFYFSASMAKYYDVKKLNLFHTNFDYSALNDAERVMEINKVISNGLVIENAYIYSHYTKPIFDKQYYIILQMNKNPVDLIPENKGIFVHGLGQGIEESRKEKLYDFYNINIGRKGAIKIDGKYYIGMNLSKNFELEKLNRFSIGLL